MNSLKRDYKQTAAEVSFFGEAILASGPLVKPSTARAT